MINKKSILAIFSLALVSLPVFSQENYEVNNIVYQYADGKGPLHEDGSIQVRTKDFKCNDNPPNKVKVESCGYEFLAAYKKDGEKAKFIGLYEKKIYNYTKNNKKGKSAYLPYKDLLKDKKGLDLLLKKLSSKEVKDMKNLNSFLTLVNKKEIALKEISASK